MKTAWEGCRSDEMDWLANLRGNGETNPTGLENR